jgi:hypothetical protein
VYRYRRRGVAAFGHTWTTEEGGVEGNSGEDEDDDIAIPVRKFVKK